jgi:hypothetical protein
MGEVPSAKTASGFDLSRFLSQVLRLPSIQRPSFDMRAFGQHIVLSSEVDIGGHHVVDRFVEHLPVVVGAEVPESRFQLLWGVVALELYDVLYR